MKINKYIIIAILGLLLLSLMAGAYLSKQVAYYKYQSEMYNSLYDEATDSIEYYKNSNNEEIAKKQVAELSYKELKNSSNNEIVNLRATIKRMGLDPKVVERIVTIYKITKDTLKGNIDSTLIALNADTIKFEFKDSHIEANISILSDFTTNMIYSINEELIVAYTLDKEPIYKGESRFRLWWTKSYIGNMFCRKEVVPHIEVKSNNPSTKIKDIIS